jgi:ribosome maturation factor RimP
LPSRPQADTLNRRKTSTGKAAEIEAMLAPTLEAMGYRVVRVLLSGGRQDQRLQIMAEPSNGSAMDVDGCAEVSRASEAILDVEDPIPGQYTLEVSSPGIDRPLTRLEDFERWAGFDAKLELTAPHDGRRRFKGRLLGVEGDEIRLEVDGQELGIPFAEVDKAKLMLTDELIAAVQAVDDGPQG